MTLTPSRSSDRLRSRPIPASSTSSRSSRASTTSARARSPPKVSRTTNPQRTQMNTIASDDESYESITNQSTRPHRETNAANAPSNNTNNSNNEVPIPDEHSTSQGDDESSYNPDIRDLKATVLELRNQLNLSAERWATAMNRVTDLQQANDALQRRLNKAEYAVEPDPPPVPITRPPTHQRAPILQEDKRMAGVMLHRRRCRPTHIGTKPSLPQSTDPTSTQIDVAIRQGNMGLRLRRRILRTARPANLDCHNPERVQPHPTQNRQCSTNDGGFNY